MGTPEDEGRHGPGRRDYDTQSAEWRGRISEQVRAHDRHLGDLNSDLRGLNQKIEGVGRSLVEVHGRLDDMREDIQFAVGKIDQARDADMDALKDRIDRARGSLQNLLFYLIGPLMIAVLAGLIIFAVTGHH